jgi:hypothetical protein
MRSHLVRLLAAAGLLVVTAHAARADVCVTVDEARDALTTEERAAALMLVTREFELEGEQVVPGACPVLYVFSHARLGDLIIVRMSGPGGEREALARGMDDLPAVYSQMTRSLLTGRPMTGFGVVDRTNVTASQASGRRIHSDSVRYARLGYGTVFGDRSYGTPTIGFGYRTELDELGVDVSFLNFQFRTSDDYYSTPGAFAWSLLKLSGLYFVEPTAARSAYFGGGLSYGGQRFGGRSGGRYYTSPSTSVSDWSGRGLQGELTVGYEMARATSLRVFVQADAVLPFYKATAETYHVASRFAPPTVTTDRRYAPSLVVSIGLGR